MVIIKDVKVLTFEKVVQFGTIHGAANALGLSQVAVTKRIQELERQLKVTLFLRSRRGMSMTEEGKALLRYCLSTQEAEGAFLSQLSNKSDHEISLTILGPTSAISTRLAQNVANLYAKYPYLRLHLRSEDHANIVQAVKKGEADFGIVPPGSAPKEMESKVLKPERYFLVASAKWRNRSLNDILKNERIIDFYENDFTTKNYLDKFGLDLSMKKSRLFVNENEALIHFFSEGIGYGTLTESVASPFLNSGVLVKLNRGQALEDPLALIWYARSREMEYFDSVIRAIK